MQSLRLCLSADQSVREFQPKLHANMNGICYARRLFKTAIAMRYTLNQTRPRDLAAPLAMVGLYDDHMLSSALAEFDELCGGEIKRLIESGDLTGKLGQVQVLFNLPGLKTSRILVVGLGEQRKFDAARYHRIVKDAIRAARATPAESAVSYLVELDVPGRDLAWKLTHALLQCDYQSYRYTQTVKNKPGSKCTEIAFTASAQAQEALEQAQALAKGITLTRELGNLPPNICNPAYLAEQALQWGKQDDCSVEVLEKADMEALGMGALLAVAAGSANAPRLIIMRYQGAGDAKPYVFVGKGITFDTGGINIKPSAGMEEMKFDMCGAATVFGLMDTIARVRPALNVIGVVPAVENMPDGASYRPSDVVKTMAGHFVEILNTDAEGRLILCDALTYALRFKPEIMIDIATLTGACVVALGNVATGLFSKHDDLADELLQAGDHMLDRAWRLPMWDDYQSQLDTGFADFANLGGKNAGAITAACFLARFVEGQRWAHLDIAGTAWDSGRKGTATGRPVSLLTHWLLNRPSAQ
jgi:leucyl aminopeptidase